MSHDWSTKTDLDLYQHLEWETKTLEGLEKMVAAQRESVEGARAESERRRKAAKPEPAKGVISASQPGNPRYT